MRALRLALILVIGATLAWSSRVRADSGTICVFNPDGSLTCRKGGKGGEPTPGPAPVCIPGATHTERVYSPYDPTGTRQCSLWERTVVDCTGEVVYAILIGFGPCPKPGPTTRQPCQDFQVSAQGITCETGQGWHLQARVPFPETYLDVRPFPVTLVRWPTALRNGGQPQASGSGRLAYASIGGGSPARPALGDWRDVNLTLSLRPAGPLEVQLPFIGALRLNDVGAAGQPTLIEWQVPSHPAAGPVRLAGDIPGFDDLPPDLPAFAGQGRSPYRLFWELHYDQYQAVQDCLPGPDANGDFNCTSRGGHGHLQVVGWTWDRHSQGGEILPDEVSNLPGELAADLNNDGVPDAFWNTNLTLRRMDDADRVDDPHYQASWNWAGAIYWAVREGQGQIGWP